MDDAEMLRVLGVDPAVLDPAPARMRGHLEERVGLPCVACPELADYTTIADVPGCGRRWVDCCRGHFLAVMKRPTAGSPRSTAELLAEVRQAAAEVGVPRRVVIDATSARSACHPEDVTDPERYRLTLYLHGRPAMDGWWGDEGIALGKFTETVGAYGRDGARIVLVDREDGGRVVASWPNEP